MDRRFTSCLVAGAALLLMRTPLDAHHAESAQFDATKPVQVSGIVKSRMVEPPRLVLCRCEG